MTKFSPAESALEGFKLVREHPGSVLIWSLFYFLGFVLVAVAMLVGVGREFIAFVKHGGMNSGDLSSFEPMIVHSFPAFVLSIVLAISVLAVLTGAICRLVLRPEEGGRAYLRFGPDELRLGLVSLLLLSFDMVCAVIVKAFADAAGGLLGSLLGLALAALIIWIDVRLLLAAPATFAERRIAIDVSWRLTRGHFWKLLGMVVLAIIFWVMVWLVFTIIGAIFIGLAGGQDAISRPSHLSPFALFAFLVTLLVQLLLPTLQIIMICSPVAEAYRELRDEWGEAAQALQPGQLTT